MDADRAAKAEYETRLKRLQKRDDAREKARAAQGTPRHEQTGDLRPRRHAHRSAGRPGRFHERRPQALGYPEHPEDAYRTKVGDGVGNLILRSLPGAATPRLVEDCKVRLRTEYATRLTRRTRPYPGVRDMLLGVRERDARVAVFSNKPDPATREICAVLFNGHPSRLRPRRHPRPAPQALPRGVLHILVTTTEPAEALYVGDTNTDMKTGKAAGLRTVGVTWGFQGEEEPRLLRSRRHHPSSDGSPEGPVLRLKQSASFRSTS
ncbi:MAG: HAD family hydrolase [Kiritimatiellia bacterium]